jgi:hypothetical protein
LQEIDVLTIVNEPWTGQMQNNYNQSYGHRHERAMLKEVSRFKSEMIDCALDLKKLLK